MTVELERTTCVERVGIPYEGGELPARLYLADDGGVPRPTIVYTGGHDATRDRGYRLIGAAALRRGYHFLAYDGPGQGTMLSENGIPLRPDWENVLGPVVDYALTVPRIDGARLVQFGCGLGSYFVARAAARDHRSAAIVCDHAMTTFYGSYPPIPEGILELVEGGDDDEALWRLEALMADDDRARLALRYGTWACGAGSIVDYVRATADYTLTATEIGRITTPALVIEGRDDPVFAGQAASFARAMTAPVHYAVLKGSTPAELHATVFDHLATALPYVAAGSVPMSRNSSDLCPHV